MRKKNLPLASLLDIPLEAVDSSNLAAIGYHRKTETLRIKFNAGTIYDHPGVPSILFKRLQKATSKGGFYNAHIKEVYEGHRIDAGLPGVRIREQLPPPKEAKIRAAAGPIEEALVRCKKLMGTQYAALPYNLWCATGREATQGKSETRYHKCLKLIAEASGCNEIGGQHVDAAIALAKERGI